MVNLPRKELDVNIRTCRIVCINCAKTVQQAGRPSLNYYVEWAIIYAGSL